MAADGSIIIDTRVNNKGAEADLKALQAKAKSTAQQISALDKKLGQATSKRSKLADDLAAARQQAEGTAKELRHIDNELQAAKAQIAAFDGAQLQEQFKNARVELQKIQGEMLSNANALEEKSDIYYKRIARKHPNVPIHAINQAADFSARSKNPELAAKESALSQQYALQSAKVDQLSNSVRALNAVRAQASGLVGKKSALESSITQQSDTVARLTGEYQRQEQTVAGLTQQRAGLAQQLDRETAAVNRQSSAMAALNMAADAAGKFGTAIRSAFSGAVSLGKKALKTLGGIGARINAATKGMRTFGRRMAEIASGALFFNLISSALSNMTRYVGSALTASGALRTALGNLAGAAQTAAAPLIQVLTPALAALANAAATVFSYIARLVAFLTGTTVSAAQQAAEGVAGVGDAAAGTADKVKKATRSLAGFDEITRLDSPQDTSGGGGGSAGTIDPNFGFTGKSPFLDSLLAAIEAGQWFQVGCLIGEKLRDSLNAIPWPDIQAKAVQWATNIADTINGAVSTPGLWEAIGHTLAQGLNTVTGFVDTFFQGVWWADIGAGLARGLTQLVAEVDWPQLGRVLTDGMRAALLTLHGFVTTYTGWADLGMSIAAMIGAALSNIDWVQAAGDLSALAIGILTAINTGLAQIDWGAVGQTVLGMLSAIDWAGVFGQLGQLFANLWPVILTTMVLPAILSWIGSVLLAALGQAIVGSLATWFSTVAIPAVLSGIGSALSAILAAIGGWPVALIAAIVAVFGLLLKAIIDNWDAICDWFSGAWDSFVAGWNDFWSLVSTNAQNWWDDVTTGWTEFWDGVSSVFDALKASLSQAWNSFWSGLATSVASIWEGIVSTVKGAVNSLIGFVNGMISAIVGGLNGAIDVLNNLSIDTPDWLPFGMGGKHLGFSISHIPAPQIPYLAQGAVIPPNREFMAVLGDQSHGTNVEAPLATIQEAVAAVMQDYQDGNLAALQQVLATLREILSAIYGINIGDEVIGQAAARYQTRQSIITGRA